MERRLAAILATDVVVYSRLIGVDGRIWAHGLGDSHDFLAENFAIAIVKGLSLTKSVKPNTGQFKSVLDDSRF